MLSSQRHETAQNSVTDLHNAIVDEVLPELAQTLYRVAANLVTVETGNLPSLFEIERKGGALAQALSGLLSFASERGFYTLQNARYAEDYFVGQSIPEANIPLQRRASSEQDMPELVAVVAAVLGEEAQIPRSTLPKRRRCRRPGCRHTFRPTRADHWYHTDSCRSAHHTQKARAAARKAKAS